MEAVIVEFAVGPDKVAECVEALTALTDSLVSKQPAYHGHTLMVEHDTGVVANIMLWDKASDFVAFRDANRSTIGPAIGHFGPKPRFYAVAREFTAKG
ncbi:MAG: antibiotic biosynthesis monooxygenase [Pseudomonadota bacterium]